MYQRLGALAFALFLPALASAQIIKTIVPDCNGPNCTLCHLVELAQNIINGGIFISIFLSAVFFAYAGWLYVSSGVEHVGSISRAKSIFGNVTIGLIIILAAWLIVDTILRGLVQGEYLPWTALCTG